MDLNNAIPPPSITNVGIPGTQVYNAAALGVYTDLDLSAVVGANYAFVKLRVENNAGIGCKYEFRPNGDTGIWWSQSWSNIANTWVIEVDIMTDANGIIEWKCTSVAGTINIRVMGYWRTAS